MVSQSCLFNNMTAQFKPENTKQDDEITPTTINKIRLHQIEMVPIEKIKRDPDNPNEMTEQQKTALEESATKFGDLAPLILDQNYIIADGEHRLDIFLKHGMKEVPAYVISLTDEQRRLLRQTMNKLRGSHDPEKDIQEIRALYDAGMLEELSTLLAKDSDDLLKLLSKSYDDIPLPEEELSPIVDEIYQVIIECTDAKNQEATFNELVQQGYKCKVLTL